MSAQQPTPALRRAILATEVARLQRASAMSSADIAAMNAGRALADELVSALAEGDRPHLLMIYFAEIAGDADSGLRLAGFAARLQQLIVEGQRPRDGGGP